MSSANAQDSRRQTATAAKPIEVALNEIVTRARVFTDAGGAAIALRDGNELVTRASTGNIAPDVGARMSIDGGLTGQAVLKAVAIHVEDSDKDPRVDAEVCRVLNTRSFIITPIAGSTSMLGVLAVFAPTPNAFTRTDLAVLRTMADQIAAALGGGAFVQQALDCENSALPESEIEAAAALQKQEPEPVLIPVPTPAPMPAPVASAPIAEPEPVEIEPEWSGPEITPDPLELDLPTSLNQTPIDVAFENLRSQAKPPATVKPAEMRVAPIQPQRQAPSTKQTNLPVNKTFRPAHELRLQTQKQDGRKERPAAASIPSVQPKSAPPAPPRPAAVAPKAAPVRKETAVVANSVSEEVAPARTPSVQWSGLSSVSEPEGRPMGKIIIGAVAALVVIGAVIAGIMFKKPSSTTASASQPASVAATAQTSAPATAPQTTTATPAASTTAASKPAATQTANSSVPTPSKPAQPGIVLQRGAGPNKNPSVPDEAPPQLAFNAGRLSLPESTGHIPTRVAGDPVAAQLLKRVAPAYPEMARRVRQKGAVEMQVQVLKDGSVGKVDVVSGGALLRSAAVDAVKQWRYRPAQLSGQAVESSVKVVINFDPGT